MGRVRVIGSANLDFVFRVPRFVRVGETLLGAEFQSHPGGKGANQAYAIGKLGGDVQFVGCVGDDPYGEGLRENLAAAGVDVSLLSSTSEAATGTAAILVDSDGRNQIVVASGANMHVTPDLVRRALQEPADITLSQLEIPIESVVEASKAERFILNPAPACQIPDEVLRNTWCITPNETETEMLTGTLPSDEQSCRVAAEWFFSRGVEHVVLTLGERGCAYFSRTESMFVATRRVQAVDTTAAGDAFNGGLAWALSRGLGWSEALETANRVATLSVMKEGAQPSMPSAAELQAALV